MKLCAYCTRPGVFACQCGRGCGVVACELHRHWIERPAMIPLPAKSEAQS